MICVLVFFQQMEETSPPMTAIYQESLYHACGVDIPCRRENANQKTGRTIACKWIIGKKSGLKPCDKI